MATFKEELSVLNGYWEYNGGRYLALLASGKVSDVFCNTGVLTTYPKKLSAWSEVLYREIVGHSFNPVVVGPGMGGITLAYELARNFEDSKAFFTEPVEIVGKITGAVVKGQKFRFELPVGREVLLTEDVITTGGSVQKTFSAIYKPDLKVAPVIACLVDRRPEDGPLQLICSADAEAEGDFTILDFKVVSLLRIKPKTWDTIEDAKKECPNVVEAIRPKQNWDKIVKG